jgi:hypothetical protein
MPRGGLRRGITGRERERLAAHGIGLRRVVLSEPYTSELDPHERVVGLDAQRTLECRGRLGRVAARGLLVGLGDECARR